MRTKYKKVPLCACGCGQKVKRNFWDTKYNTYLQGHYSRPKELNKLMGEMRKGQNNPNWKGGEITKPDGRVMVYVGAGKYQYRARYLMEQQLSRKLFSTEVVHHINGDKTDDRLENLKLITFSEHSVLHNKGRKKSKETIEKQRKSLTGFKHSEETRHKMSESHKGHTVSKETRDKISISNKGKKFSCGMFGKNHTKETKYKISDKLKQLNKKEKHDEKS